MSTSKPKPSRSERARILLHALVRRYIREGVPVGSKAVLEESALALSPATVRHVMADLEAEGLLRSPHTSAGRVPTERAFRLYADTLLQSRKVETSLKALPAELENRLEQVRHRDEVFEVATDMLTELTHMAGVVRLPHRQAAALQQVEFMPLSGGKLLVVLVFSDQEVQNRIVQLEQDISREELQQASNFINEHYAGLSLSEAYQALRERLDSDREKLRRLGEVLGLVADESLNEAESLQQSLLVKGEDHLLDGVMDETGIEQARELLGAISRRQDVLSILDKCLEADGVQIFIGRESGYQMLADHALVSAPYHQDGGAVGTLAVVGPARMDYQQTIAAVDITAQMISLALNRLQ